MGNTARLYVAGQTHTRTVAPSIWDRERWLCNTESELEAALCEYHTAEDEGVGDGDDDLDKELERDRRGRIFAQNLEIDRGMVALRAKHVPLWRLLHQFYREEPRWTERRGWIGPARAFGIAVPKCPGPVRCIIPGDDRMELPTCTSGQACRTMFDTWEVQKALAIRALLRAIQGR